MPSLDALLEKAPAAPAPSPLATMQHALATHPRPVLAWVETALWLLLAISVVDHLANPNGTVGGLVWWLTIGQHELGHLLCMPFGTLIMFLGGTIWQVLFWVLIGVWEGVVRKRWRVLLLCGVISGHSFINAAVYIADARARSLPLLFGLSSDHHDWYNILSMTGLLEFDSFFAWTARIFGILLIFSAAGLGIWGTWVRSH
jgi:hypothetical protein